MTGAELSAAIASAGATIYDSLEDRPELIFSLSLLESHLRGELIGIRVPGEIRTRSKLAKRLVASALGYPVPASFQRTQPRFPGQNLDVHVQKANNLQIWNEELDPDRRHAILRVDDNAVITAVRVVDGETLARLDTTGTLTQKYQASRLGGHTGTKLVSTVDTERFQRLLTPVNELPREALADLDPLHPPERAKVLAIQPLFVVLQALPGRRLARAELQERNRGAALQRTVCDVLGLSHYADHGQFPDIPCQALEVKAQSSPTIDLGLVTPDSTDEARGLAGLRHCDVRYCVAELEPRDGEFEVTAVVVSAGEDFFREFRAFEGLRQNRKLQMHLPPDFFVQSEPLPD
jgi:hypothetical protein